LNDSLSASARVDIFNSASGTWTTTTLSQARFDLAATSVGDFALFGGGIGNSDDSDAVVDIFNSTSGTWTTTTLPVAFVSLAATSVGKLALFGGGQVNNDFSALVDIFNSASGTWTTATLSVARSALGATSVGDFALFGGGVVNNVTTGNASAVVDIFHLTTPTITPSPAATAGASPAAPGTASTMYSFLFWPNPCTLLLSLWH